MKIFVKVIIVFNILVALYSCSPLSKTQTKAINQFYQTIGTYPNDVRELQKYSAKIKLNRLQLYPESYSIDSVMIESLIASFENYQKEAMIVNELDSILNVFDKHIKDYFLFTKNGFKLMKVVTSGSTALGRYLGLGNLIETAVTSISSDNMRMLPFRSKKLKSHLCKGEEIIAISTSVIDTFAQRMLMNELTNEYAYIKNNYKSFLSELKDKPGSKEYYTLYNKIFINHFQIIYNTRQLASELIISSKKLNSAYNVLLKNTEERKKIKFDIREIQQLYLEINKIKSIIETLKMLEYSTNIIEKN